MSSFHLSHVSVEVDLGPEAAPEPHGIWSYLPSLLDLGERRGGGQAPAA